jgi:hypothetical protein
MKAKEKELEVKEVLSDSFDIKNTERWIYDAVDDIYNFEDDE